MLLAANPIKLLEDASKGTYQTAGGSAQIFIIVETIIKAALSVTGAVLFGFIFYAGYQYMTAAGNEEKTKDAVKVIKDCVIGLAIILLSWIISQFIIQSLVGATIATPSAPK
jgi:phosphatidylglycerophosphatase A